MNIQQVSEKCLKAHVHKGKALAALGKYNEAVISYRSACEVDPSKESVIRGKNWQCCNDIESSINADMF